jgi:hypothetical protein
MSEQTIDIWEAIRRMREMSKVGQPFSIRFMGCNYTKGQGTGIHQIDRCLLRASTPTRKNQYANYMLNLVDQQTGKARQCWQPLLMYFNNLKIVINGPHANK